MQLGLPKIVRCPFCGRDKKLLGLRSGNNFGADEWSDQKVIAPMLPRVSFVQKCHKCGRYYLLSRQKERYARKGFCFYLGTLNYAEMVEAFHQLAAEGFENIKEECRVRVLLLHTFNDEFMREESRRNNTPEQPSETERQLMDQNIHWLIENWASNDLIKAELYREAGHMEKALELLETFECAEGGFRSLVKDEIIRRAKANDQTVFETTGMRQQAHEHARNLAREQMKSQKGESNN